MANRFIDQTQPWAMVKSKDPALGHALWCLQSSLWLIARLIAPVLPATAGALRGWLGDGDAAMAWPAPADGRVLPLAPAGLAARAPSPLFPRLDDKLQQVILDKIVPPDAAAGPAAGRRRRPRHARRPIAPPGAPPAAEPRSAPLPPIKIDEFGRIELRVGTVLSAAAVPKARKLLQLSVDLGEPQPRSIVAGIAETYAPDQIVGKQVIVVANLEPATIRGIPSQGMLLAAGDGPGPGTFRARSPRARRNAGTIGWLDMSELRRAARLVVNAPADRRVDRPGPDARCTPTSRRCSGGSRPTPPRSASGSPPWSATCRPTARSSRPRRCRCCRASP